jgi:RNA-directed DNA polymerase
MKDRVRKITSRKRGNSLKQIIEELTSYLRGWNGYFGYCQTPSVLQKLEQWIRRKLRCIVWKRWKRSSTRFKRLRAMGLSITHAREGAGNGSRGPWRMSASPPLHNALSVAYFEILGLPRLMCRNPA